MSNKQIDTQTDRRIVLSVIMPVYNGEKFISEAIWSVLNQPKKDLLLIVVDDGSKDRTKEILLEIEKQDNRLLVYSQKNSGVSAARNKGLEISISKGVQYVAFLDADDVWCKDFYDEKIIERLCQHKYDLLGFDYFDGSEDLSRGKMNCALEEKQRLGLHFCSYIYSLDVIRYHKIKFPDGIRYNEDVLYLFVFSYYCKAYFYTHNKFLFIYRNNPLSVMHNQKSIYDTIFESLLPVWNWCMDTLHFDEEVVSLCKTMIRTYIIEYLELACQQGDSPTKIIQTIEGSKYEEYLLDDKIWISEKHNKILTRFRERPNLVYIKERIKHYYHKLRLLLKKNKTVEYFYYNVSIKNLH